MKRHPASASLSLLRLGPGDVALGVAGLNSLEIGHEAAPEMSSITPIATNDRAGSSS